MISVFIFSCAFVCSIVAVILLYVFVFLLCWDLVVFGDCCHVSWVKGVMYLHLPLVLTHRGSVAGNGSVS